MKQLLFLHGAIGAKTQLQPIADSLAGEFQVHLYNFSGHGGKEITSGFSIQNFADEVRKWLGETGIDQVNIFGYSMGGYVGLYMAAHYPGLVDKLITLGTKFEWTDEIAAKETAMLQPATIETKLPKFATQLQQRHHPTDWHLVLKNTADMLSEMGRQPPLTAADLGKIKNNVLLLLGDRDKMVTLHEIVTVYKQLLQAQLAVLPNTPHPIETVDAELLLFFIRKFLR